MKFTWWDYARLGVVLFFATWGLVDAVSCVLYGLKWWLS